ncbi:MAG: transposase [Acidobacteriales bacterium]|nr:transposase [Terriglobales bacterium]
MAAQVLVRHNELVYPGDFVSGTDICPALNSYFHFYNFQRPHQALNYRTPAQLYLGLESIMYLQPSVEVLHVEIASAGWRWTFLSQPDADCFVRPDAKST